MMHALSHQKGAVHLWKINLDDSKWDEHVEILSPDEVSRAETFRLDNDRLHFQRCRIARRLVLANYLQKKPGEIRFINGRWGKPGILSQKLHFNISHCSANAVLAICREPIGVDLESYRRHSFDVNEVAQAVLHQSEAAVFANSAAKDRCEIFFRIWSQKEAYCKFLGLGLYKSLTAINFRTQQHMGVNLVVDDENGPYPRCYTHDIADIDGHASSLCIASSRVYWSRFQAEPEDLVRGAAHGRESN